MVQKQVICPERVRKTPKQFSWLDHRLVRDHYIDQCTHRAAALYLFLVCVADAKGLSYWADRTICTRLALDETLLPKVRNELVDIGLVAYQKPLYQVLDLDCQRQKRSSDGQIQSLGDLFKQMKRRVS